MNKNDSHNQEEETEEQKIYDSMYDYFAENSDEFLDKTRYTFSNYVYFAIAAGLFFLAYQPEVIGLTGIGFRILFGVLACTAAGIGLLKNTTIIHKPSGKVMEPVHFRKYSLENHDIDDLIEAFDERNFEGLSEVPSSDNASLRVSVWANESAKLALVLFYNQYYGETNYSSEVLRYEGSEYDANIERLKQI